MIDQNLTPKPAITAAPAAVVASTPSKLATFEDCLTLVTAAIAATEIGSKDEALRKIEGFFKDRIARKAKNEDRDGTTSVRNAIEASRSFKPRSYATPKIDDKPGA
jgi:hypothetical protein